MTRRDLLLTVAWVMATTGCSVEEAAQAPVAEPGLRDLFRDDFLLGTAIDGVPKPTEPAFFRALVEREFNCVTPENDMKWRNIHPAPDTWNWSGADAFVDFAHGRGLRAVGHTLLWHSQMADWVLAGAPNAGVLRGRVDSHISTLVDRYKGRIHTWDVVNEALDGGGWRQTPWLDTLGPEYLARAFHLAHDADPAAHLIYNDYSLDEAPKRRALLEWIAQCRKANVPLHGIGLQGHMGLDYPDLHELELTIEAIAATGLRLHITELDVDVLPFDWNASSADLGNRAGYAAQLDPYIQGLPEPMQQRLAERYAAIFRLFLRHRDKIDRVTLWGVSDATSWRNDFPVPGRTNYPLLFDRQYRKKPSYFAVANLKRADQNFTQ